MSNQIMAALRIPRVESASKGLGISRCFEVVRPAGFEPATSGLEVPCSIQLSYGRRERLSAASASIYKVIQTFLLLRLGSEERYVMHFLRRSCTQTCTRNRGMRARNTLYRSYARNAMITELDLRAIEPNEKIQLVWVNREVNLSLRIYPTGTKTWVWRGRVKGQITTLTGKSFSEISMIEALAWARGVMQDRAAGKKLIPAWREEQIAEDAQKSANNRTVDVVFTQYMEIEGSLGRDGKEKQRKYDKDIKPEIDHRPIASLTYEDLYQLVCDKNQSGHKIAANRLHSLIARFMKWSVSNGRTYSRLTDNCYQYAVKLNRESSRDRYLEDDEIVLLWRALESKPPIWKSFYKMILLTGARRDEAAGMTRAELRLSGDTPEWKLDASRVKNGLPHVVPLSPYAISVIKDAGESPIFVFPSSTGKPICGFSKTHERILKHMAELGFRGKRFTLHDLRRTTITKMNELGVPDIVTEMIINHVSGRRSGVAGTYNRYAYIKEKREGLALLSDDIETITA